MRIVLIGAGNLATHLGSALSGAGHEVVQVYSRTEASARQLAGRIGCAQVTTDCRDIIPTAEVYVFAVKDSVLAELIPQVCAAVGTQDKVFLHTAGSMPMSCFAGSAPHYGVLYPMQTFSKSRDVCFREIPCFIEANDTLAHSRIRAMAESVSGVVRDMSSADRRYLHLAAVWACNFVNHCYDVAAVTLAEHGIPFEVMLPLIDETARKVHDLLPVEAQTGPAVRYDENVIGAQSELLHGDPLWQELYRLLSRSIHERYNNK